MWNKMRFTLSTAMPSEFFQWRWMNNSIISMCRLFNQHAVRAMICDGFTQEKLIEIYHGCQVLVSPWVFWADSFTSFIIFVLQIMDNKPAYSTQRRLFWGPRKVFKHTVYTLNFSCPPKTPWNQIKLALLSKSRINFPSPWLEKGVLSVVPSGSWEI